MDRFDAYVRENQGQYITELQKICRMPSIAAQGIGMQETADFIVGRMEQAGFQAHTIPVEDGAPVVFAEGGTGDHVLLVYDHYDVQPADPLDLWESDPYEAEMRDGRIFARGVSDNKGPLMARIHAFEAYQTVFGELPLTIKFVVEGEEEIGSPNLGRFVTENRNVLEGADACLWEGGYKDTTGRQVISLGKKGICYLELSVTGANSDLHSSWGGLVINPAWRLNWALSTFKNQEEHITIDGLMDHVVEPNEPEWELLRKIPFDEEQIKSNFGVTRFAQGVTDVEAVKKYLFEPTCTICGISSGYSGPGSKTVLPNKAVAKVDIRLVPNLTPELVFRLVRDHLDQRGFADVEITLLSQLYPYRSEVDHPWVHRTIEIATEFYGETPIVEPSGAGGGPMYQLCGSLGIPGIATGGVRHAKSNIHAPNENIFVADYIETITFTGHLVRALATI